METKENSSEEKKPITRVQKMLAAQERMNKAHNVSPEHQKMVNNLFRSPVISFSMSYSNLAKENMDENPDDKKSLKFVNHSKD